MADFSKITWFKPSEFSHPEKMDQALVEKLDALRGLLGRPIKISSSYRDPEHNAVVGGAEGSQHLSGHAVDIVLPADGAYHYDIVRLAMNLEFTGIGEKRQSGRAGMLHLDNRPLATRAKWTYHDAG